MSGSDIKNLNSSPWRVRSNKMNVTVNHNPASAPQERVQKTHAASPFDGRFGAWGIVESVNSDDNTVDVFLDTGRYLNRVPVASKEWVIFGEDAEKDFNTGERDLPPVRSRVFVFMPTFTFSDCFVAPFSGFNNADRNISEPFLEDEKQKIKERVTPSGWHVTDDYVTGSHKSVSPDKKTYIEIDYGTEEEPKEENSEVRLNIFDEVSFHHKRGESCTVRAFDTEWVIEPGKVTMKPKETIVEVDGNATFKTSGNATIEATGNADVIGRNVTVKASDALILDTGDASAFAPNTMPMCPLGPVHGGRAAGIIRLRGA